MADSSIDPIRQFVLANTSGVDVLDDEDIFAAGYVNSLFAVQLVLWVEQTFGVPMTSEDLNIDHFRTISAIAAYVDRRRELAGGVAAQEGGRGWTSA